MEEAPTSGPAASMALGKYLLDNAALQTALSMYQHAQERAMRTALRASLPAAAAQQLVAYYRAMMESLVQKVKQNASSSLSLFFFSYAYVMREMWPWADIECTHGGCALGVRLHGEPAHGERLQQLQGKWPFLCGRGNKGVDAKTAWGMGWRARDPQLGLATVGKRYDRLRTVSGVGLSCAKLWHQRTFLLDMQAIATNARWWHVLSTLGPSPSAAPTGLGKPLTRR